jgi:hypothetical protein
MKYYLIVFILITSSICSCNRYSNNILVKNSSNRVVDSVIVLGNVDCKSLKFSKILQKSTRKGNLANCQANNQGDGSFKVKVYIGKEVFESSLGYFTNGVSIFKNIEIEIKNDYNIVNHISY